MKPVKKKICVITGTRAEYGLLSGLMRRIKNDKDLTLQLIVTGMHLERRFGYTYAQIVKDGFTADVKIPMKLTSDTDADIVRGVGREFIGLSAAFERLMPDMVVVLGDRFETLAVAIAATLFRIPVAHIHGGEVTEGAYDDGMRHAITKLASLHFVVHQDYARRVMQMGEESHRVFVVGSPGVENIKQLVLPKQGELEQLVGFTLGQGTALVTFHPITNEKGATRSQIKALLSVLKRSNMKVIFTLPNADADNNILRTEINAFVRAHSSRARLFASFGHLRYFGLMNYAGIMIGNSSSGLIEAPSFKLPVVNIGSRQEGRIKPGNVIDCNSDERSIYSAIARAQSPEFRKSLQSLRNPFDGGKTSLRIAREIKRFVFHPMSAKKFVDCV